MGGGDSMTVHYSVTVDFDADDLRTKPEVYDMFEDFVEQTFGGVMTACTPYIDDEEAGE